MSYFGNEDFIKNKLVNFAHQEYNNDKVKSEIKKRIENNEDLFLSWRNSEPFSYVPIKVETLPKHYKLIMLNYKK